MRPSSSALWMCRPALPVSRFTIIADQNGFVTPPLLPASYLEAAGAKVDFHTSTYWTPNYPHLGFLHRTMEAASRAPRPWPRSLHSRDFFAGQRSEQSGHKQQSMTWTLLHYPAWLPTPHLQTLRSKNQRSRIIRAPSPTYLRDQDQQRTVKLEGVKNEVLCRGLRPEVQETPDQAVHLWELVQRQRLQNPNLPQVLKQPVELEPPTSPENVGEEDPSAPAEQEAKTVCLDRRLPEQWKGVVLVLFFEQDNKKPADLKNKCSWDSGSDHSDDSRPSRPWKSDPSQAADKGDKMSSMGKEPRVTAKGSASRHKSHGVGLHWCARRNHEPTRSQSLMPWSLVFETARAFSRHLSICQERHDSEQDHGDDGEGRSRMPRTTSEIGREEMRGAWSRIVKALMLLIHTTRSQMALDYLQRKGRRRTSGSIRASVSH